MIEINATGFCKDCPYMKIDWEETEIDGVDTSGDRFTSYLYDVVCIHELVCENWNQKLKEMTKTTSSPSSVNRR